VLVLLVLLVPPPPVRRVPVRQAALLNTLRLRP
jgi:hypothetical protein